MFTLPLGYEGEVTGNRRGDKLSIVARCLAAKDPTKFHKPSVPLDQMFDLGIHPPANCSCIKFS